MADKPRADISILAHFRRAQHFSGGPKNWHKGLIEITTMVTPNDLSLLGTSLPTSLFTGIQSQYYKMMEYNPSASFQHGIASRPIGPKEGNATKRPAAQYVIEPQNELDDPDASLVRQMQHEMQLGFRAFSSQLGAQLEPLVKLTPTLQVITAQ